MSFFYIRPYLSVVDDNRCPISIYNRFLIALFILGIGLTASVMIKELPQKEAVSKSLKLEEGSVPVKGGLESFPRDFTLNSTDPVGSYRFPIRNNVQDSKPQRYSVGMPPEDMGAKYPGDCELSDVDEKPSLPPGSGDISEEDLLRLGYRRHITVNGDSLGKLAEKYLHDVERWTEIYELNRSKLSNKDVIPIGIVLIIPAQ